MEAVSCFAICIGDITVGCRYSNTFPSIYCTCTVVEWDSPARLNFLLRFQNPRFDLSGRSIALVLHIKVCNPSTRICARISIVLPVFRILVSFQYHSSLSSSIGVAIALKLPVPPFFTVFQSYLVPVFQFCFFQYASSFL